LEAAIDVIRIRIVQADVIELRNRQVQLMFPPSPAVFTSPQPTVVARINNVRVVRVEPDVVMVAMSIGYSAEALATINAQKQRTVRLEKLVRILRIHNQVGKVERPPDDELAGIETLPVGTAIV
jgi:hypothetical protein